MADANELVAPRLGLPQLPVVDFPDDDEIPLQGMHWKTRFLTQWAGGRPFVWLDDEISDADHRWVQMQHQGTALLHRVDPFTGLTDADFRFKARVWFLRAQKSVCPGCATGCNSFMDYDPRDNRVEIMLGDQASVDRHVTHTIVTPGEIDLVTLHGEIFDNRINQPAGTQENTSGQNIALRWTREILGLPHDAGGALLVVSQFTLYADVRRGRRPGFTDAALPEQAVPLIDRFVERLRASVRVQTGRFGAEMAVELVNDGPFTLVLDSARDLA